MERGNRKGRILSVAILLTLMTILSCYVAGRSGKEASDEKTAVPGREAAGEKFPEEEGTGEEELVFGRKIESEETLAEDIVQALKNGDTEYLVGVPFGEGFDYELYRRYGEECRRKEPVYDGYLSYLFDGEGHRFSGFSIGPGRRKFSGAESGRKCCIRVCQSFWRAGYLRKSG